MITVCDIEELNFSLAKNRGTHSCIYCGREFLDSDGTGAGYLAAIYHEEICLENPKNIGCETCAVEGECDILRIYKHCALHELADDSRLRFKTPEYMRADE